ncbi:MAG TPA: hypothetical protein VMT00_10975 [Thermoanaerobaculia bacterium]|nr:hypothetical protein [Thermoanaerobaculia bacterium]
MKRILLIFAVCAFTAGALTAQTFTLGGRFSNYATDLDIGIVTIETGRESSVGIIGEYRAGVFVLRGQFDHDFEGGLSAGLIPIDLAEYSRDRFEATAGYAPLPFIDFEAGFRMETLSIGGFSFFGNQFFSDLDFDHQAIVVGVNAHTQSMTPAGWYGSARAYIGSADFEFEGLGVSSDTTGYRIETGVPIAIGTSRWHVTPGVEFEHIETDRFGFQIDSNRFFVNFAYRFGG